MKILVTGALGFIGSNIAEKLVKEGHEVIALDNMHTGREENIAAIKGKIKVHKKNAGEIESLRDSFDAVFHQGIYSSSPMYKQDPHLAAKALDEWISVLEFARKHPCRLVYASSSSLYNGNVPPHREDMKIGITDFYTEGRYAMERVAKLYDDFYGVKSVGLRYFSVYGPHERSKGKYANLVTQFLWEMQAGKRPVILGDGKQTRDFTYVGDVVRANILAMAHDGSGVFNVGTGRSVSLNDVVTFLNMKLKTSIKPEYRENTIKNYVMHTQASTEKAEKELGFRATVVLEDGIDRLMEHYKKG